MKVYQCDDNGYFCGVVEADPSPLELGVWHIPRGCVLVEPPLADPGYLLRWTGDGWETEPIPVMPEEPTEPTEPTPTKEEIANAVWQAATDYERVHGVNGSGHIVMAQGLLLKMPEAIAIQKWLRELWDDAFARIQQAMDGKEVSLDFTRPEKPYPIMQLDMMLRSTSDKE